MASSPDLLGRIRETHDISPTVEHADKRILPLGLLSRHDTSWGVRKEDEETGISYALDVAQQEMRGRLAGLFRSSSAFTARLFIESPGARFSYTAETSGGVTIIRGAVGPAEMPDADIVRLREAEPERLSPHEAAVGFAASMDQARFA